jgi:hypothetical protein
VKTNTTLRDLMSAVALCSTNIAFEAGDEIYFELTSASGESWVKQKQNEKKSDELKYVKKLNFFQYYFNTLSTSSSSDELLTRRYVILVYNGKDFVRMGDFWNGTVYSLTTAHVYFGNKSCCNWQRDIQLERSERRAEAETRRAEEAVTRAAEETRRAEEANTRAAEETRRAEEALTRAAEETRRAAEETRRATEEANRRVAKVEEELKALLASLKLN